jgi:hypothetical protein
LGSARREQGWYRGFIPSLWRDGNFYSGPRLQRDRVDAGDDYHHARPSARPRDPDTGSPARPIPVAPSPARTSRTSRSARLTLPMLPPTRVRSGGQGQAGTGARSGCHAHRAGANDTKAEEKHLERPQAEDTTTMLDGHTRGGAPAPQSRGGAVEAGRAYLGPHLPAPLPHGGEGWPTPAHRSRPGMPGGGQAGVRAGEGPRLST